MSLPFPLLRPYEATTVDRTSAAPFQFSATLDTTPERAAQAVAPMFVPLSTVTEHSHFDPASCLEIVRADVPDFDTLQSQVAQATIGHDVHMVLDSGTGTGATAAALPAVHPSALPIGVDESEPMLEQAHALVPDAALLVRRLEDPLPAGPFDVVTSVLAIHHLDGAVKPTSSGGWPRP